MKIITLLICVTLFTFINYFVVLDLVMYKSRYMSYTGRPHCPTCPTLSYFVLLFSFDKKCPTCGPKIAQMSYFVLLLRVCVLLFNDGWKNDNFWVVFVKFFAAMRQEDPTLVLTCSLKFCRYVARRPIIGLSMLPPAKCPCLIVHSWQQGKLYLPFSR